MRYFILVAALFLACASPNEPSEFQQFALADSIASWVEAALTEPAPADSIAADWPPPGHFCGNPIWCPTCWGSIGARDHDGDGIKEDLLRDHPQEGASIPPNPSGTSPLQDWTGWTLGSRVRD